MWAKESYQVPLHTPKAPRPHPIFEKRLHALPGVSRSVAESAHASRPPKTYYQLRKQKLFKGFSTARNTEGGGGGVGKFSVVP